MKMNFSYLILLYTLLTILNSGCGSDASTSGGATPTARATPAPESVAITNNNTPTSIFVTSATAAQCNYGGSIIQVFKDSNSNGSYDSGETIVSTTPVCNGVPGSAGITGSSGTNSSTNSSTGTKTNSSTGTNSNSNTDSNSGTPSAQYETGPVGPAVAGKSYSACHHDYFYFPDSSGKTYGLLMFRHQQNGTADEGSGKTGFNVWTVDIADFYLNSEVGAVTYCQVHWDFTKKAISYQVWDKNDGYYRKTGTIVF